MPLIPDRLLAQMTPDERELWDAVVEGWRRHQPRIDCPQCGAHISVRLKIYADARLDAQELTPPKSEEQRVSEWTDGLTPHERNLLDECERVGLLKAFEEAVNDEKAGQVPTNIRKFLLTFLQTARLDTVPRFVLEEYADAFAPAQLMFYSAQGIFAVQADGVTRAFFAKSRFAGRSIARRVPGAMAATFRDNGRMSEWIRSRFGYIPAESSLFNQAMRQQNIGKFGRLVQ